MKIIKQGHVNPFPIEVHCQFCNSQLEADFEDVQNHRIKGSDIRNELWDVTEYFIQCPVCGTKAALNDKDFVSTYNTERIIRERQARGDASSYYTK